MTAEHSRGGKKAVLFSVLFIASALIPALCIIGAYVYFSYGLPRISSLKDYRPPLVTELYSQQDEIIGEFFIEKRYLITLADISPLLIQAIIASEDDRFFEHKGINLWSIVRAALKNIRSFEIRQGGSTITQQIVKTLLLTPEKSFSRKIKEAILATRIEKSLSKDDILTLYLNQIYFGHGVYGVEAACRFYFGKSAAQVNLAEASLLAGLPKAPNYYSPYNKLQRAKKRQDYVLHRMFAQGYITPEEKRDAAQMPLEFNKRQNSNLLKAPYFVEYIRKDIERRYGADFLYREGARIETTLDGPKQYAARQAVAKGVAAYEQREGGTEDNATVQAALIAVDPFSGYVLAMVGGRDFKESQFNRAVQAHRQAGSAFKPIIYAAALDKGYTPASIIIDSPLAFFVKKDEDYMFWEPQNYSKTFVGPSSLRKALTRSCNIITIKILKDIGINYVVKYARQLGVEGDFNYDLTLALGTCGISLLNMVKCYAVFCAGGVSAQPIYIKRILDRDGTVIEENQPRLSSVISAQTAYLMSNLLRNVVEEGTGRKVRALSRPCAGKTGTTNEYRDAWFLGFTPQMVAGAWVGFDDLRTLGEKETGARAASPVWLDFMKEALKGEPVKEFAVPEGIVFVKIDPETGYFPTDKNKKTIFECFKEGTLPTSFVPAQLERF